MRTTLLQFAASYLCKLRFSTITCKKRKNVQCIDEETRVCLSSIIPNIEKIARSHQVHVSH